MWLGYRVVVPIIYIIEVSGKHSIESIIHSKSIVRFMVAFCPCLYRASFRDFFFLFSGCAIAGSVHWACSVLISVNHYGAACSDVIGLPWVSSRLIVLSNICVIHHKKMQPVSTILHGC